MRQFLKFNLQKQALHNIKGMRTATIRRYCPEAHNLKKRRNYFLGEFKDGLNILMQATALLILMTCPEINLA